MAKDTSCELRLPQHEYFIEFLRFYMLQDFFLRVRLYISTSIIVIYVGSEPRYVKMILSRLAFARSNHLYGF